MGTPPLDGVPRRTSPRTLLFSGIGVVVALVVWVVQLAVISAAPAPASAQQDGSGFPTALFVVFMLVGAGLNGWQWWARTYVVGVDELVIDEGILQRRRRVVPYGRVQQIDVDERLLAQILGLATLTIETAGSAGGTVRLGMLEAGLARDLQGFVLQRRERIHAAGTSPRVAGAPGASSAEEGSDRPVAASPDRLSPSAPPVAAASPPERELVRLSAARLAVAGATHHFVAVFGPVVVLAGLVIGAFAVPANRDTSAVAVLATAVGLTTAIGVVTGLVVFGQYVVGRYGYTLSERGDDLQLRSGLFQVRTVTIPRRRVQHVTVSDNPLRRMLGLVRVQLHSAAPTVDVHTSNPLLRTLGSVGGAGADFEVPILDRRDLSAFLGALMGPGWTIPRLTPRPVAARRRAVTRRVGLLALVLAVPSLLFPPGSLALLAVALVGVPLGLVAHRRAGYGATDRVVVLARGVLHHRVDLLPHDRIQSASTSSSPFQRFAGLKTLHVDVAGRAASPDLYDLDGAVAFRDARGLPRRSVPGGPSGGGSAGRARASSGP